MKNNYLKIKKITLLFSTVILSACSSGIISAGAFSNNVHLWTTYSNTLVLRDDDSYKAPTLVKPTILSENSDINLSISMGKGEIEGAQLIITPTNRINSFDFEVSDLTFGDNVISKDSIGVYQQFYGFVGSKETINNEDTSHNFNYIPYGYYPDFLVPFEWSKQKKENYIIANQNQGLTIEVETSFATVPGTYVGSFKLTLDGEVTNIPVKVKVYDVDLSKSYLRAYACSCSYITYSQYDWLLNKYRVHGQFGARGSISPEHLLESINYYWDNPRFNNFEIPNGDVDSFTAYLRFLARNSTLSRNYLTRCSVYLQNQDEPNGINGPEDASAVCLTYKNAKEKVKGELINYFPGNTELINAVSTAIDNIPLMLTVNLWRSEHTAKRFDCASNGVTFCLSQSPAINEEVYDEFAKESATPLWQYANASYPYTGHSLPNLGTASRLQCWGDMQYGYVGFLFWDLDETRSDTGGAYAERYRTREYFEDLYSFQTSIGSGCVVVPASKFGHPEAFIATCRLRSTRDGIEDHTLLTKLKEYYETYLLGEYNLANDYDFNERLEWVYSRLLSHAGIFSDCTDDDLFDMREQIFKLLELAKSEYRVVNGGITYDNNKAQMTLFAKTSSITVDNNVINGTPISDGSCKFVINYDAETAASIYSTIGIGNESWRLKIFNYGKLTNAFETADMTNLSALVSSSPKGRQVAAGTVEFQNNKLIFTIPKGATSDSDNIGYSPEFKFKSALFGVSDIFDIEHISFKIRVKYGASKDYLSIRVFDNLLDSFNGEFDRDIKIDNSSLDTDGYFNATVSYDVRRVPQSKISSISYILSSFHGDKVNKFHDGAIIEISDLYFSKYVTGGVK